MAPLRPLRPVHPLRPTASQPPSADASSRRLKTDLSTSRLPGVAQSKPPSKLSRSRSDHSLRDHRPPRPSTARHLSSNSSTTTTTTSSNSKNNPSPIILFLLSLVQIVVRFILPHIVSARKTLPRSRRQTTIYALFIACILLIAFLASSDDPISNQQGTKLNANGQSLQEQMDTVLKRERAANTVPEKPSDDDPEPVTAERVGSLPLHAQGGRMPAGLGAQSHDHSYDHDTTNDSSDRSARGSDATNTIKDGDKLTDSVKTVNTMDDTTQKDNTRKSMSMNDIDTSNVEKSTDINTQSISQAVQSADVLRKLMLSEPNSGRTKGSEGSLESILRSMSDKAGGLKALRDALNEKSIRSDAIPNHARGSMGNVNNNALSAQENTAAYVVKRLKDIVKTEKMDNMVDEAKKNSADRNKESEAKNSELLRAAEKVEVKFK